MVGTSNEHVLELLPDAVLGCLSPEQAGLVAAHTARCPVCRGELAALQAASDRISLTCPDVEPPSRLKAAILEKIQPAPKIGFITNLRAWLSGGRAVWGWVSLALAILLTASSLALVWQARSRQQAADPEFRVISMAGESAAPDAKGVMIITHNGETGTLVVDGLPVLASDQQYQLWLIADGQRTSGGVFSVDEAGYGALVIQAPRPLIDYPSFGVTIEPRGGSPGPTGAKVLGGKL